jgi:hypothetical protein
MKCAGDAAAMVAVERVRLSQTYQKPDGQSRTDTPRLSVCQKPDRQGGRVPIDTPRECATDSTFLSQSEASPSNLTNV